MKLKINCTVVDKYVKIVESFPKVYIELLGPYGPLWAVSPVSLAHSGPSNVLCLGKSLFRRPTLFEHQEWCPVLSTTKKIQHNILYFYYFKLDHIQNQILKFLAFENSHLSARPYYHNLLNMKSHILSQCGYFSKWLINFKSFNS